MLRRPAESEGITPGRRPSRFGSFDVLNEVDKWDAVTAGVVLDRLGRPPDLRFFTPDEEAVGRRLFDLLLDQRDDPRVPILEMVDSRMAEGETDGWHYADMPEDGEAFRRSFAALDADAREHHGERFARVAEEDAHRLVQAVQDLGSKPWHGMPASRVWSLWTRYGTTAFYSHPWAWNEMGFPGPAYPRGYGNLGTGRREHWEEPDRVPWRAPGRVDLREGPQEPRPRRPAPDARRWTPWQGGPTHPNGVRAADGSDGSGKADGSGKSGGSGKSEGSDGQEEGR